MKKRYRRVLALAMALSIAVMLCAAPAAAVEDTAPPVIHSAAITQKVVIGETVTLTLDAEDEVSGVKLAFLTYRSAAGTSYTLTFTNPGASQSFAASLAVPLAMEPGVWTAEHIAVYDYAQNGVSYVRGGEGPVDFSKLDLTIADNPDKDCVAPTLRSLTVKNSRISAPGKVEFEAEITDNAPGEIRATMYIYVGTFRDAVGLVYNPSTGTYQGALSIAAADKRKTIAFESLFLYDSAGNMVSYIDGDPTQVSSDQIVRRLNPSWVPKITITNAIRDTIPPKLREYSYDEQRVYAPASVNYTMEIEDADPEGMDATVTFFYEPDGQSAQFFCHSGLRYVGGTTFAATGSLTLDQYTEPGSLYIHRLELTDSSGNTQVYTVDGSEGERLPKKSVRVVSGRSPDLTTGTTVTGYLEKIRAASDDAVIVLDCTGDSRVPAAAFAAIRGTNRTLILNHNGIEWVFFGDSLPNADKAVDCAVSYRIFRGGAAEDYEEDSTDAVLAELLQSKPALLIQFAPNGQLPGPALVRIKAEYTFRDEIGIAGLDAYFYNEQQGRLDAVDKGIAMAEDGYYPFVITHNSAYLLAPQKGAGSVPASGSGGEGGGASDAPETSGSPEGAATGSTDSLDEGSTAGIGEESTSAPSKTETAGRTDAAAAGTSTGAGGGQRAGGSMLWGILAAAIGGVVILALVVLLAVPRTRMAIRRLLRQGASGPSAEGFPAAVDNPSTGGEASAEGPAGEAREDGEDGRQDSDTP